jgi:hypothetical protein
MRLGNVVLAVVLIVWALCLVYDLIFGNHNNKKNDKNETEC